MTPAARAVIALAVAGTTMAAAAWAQQNAPIQATPLPPLQRQWQDEGSPPVQEGPAAPGVTGLAAPGSQCKVRTRCRP